MVMVFAPAVGKIHHKQIGKGERKEGRQKERSEKEKKEKRQIR